MRFMTAFYSLQKSTAKALNKQITAIFKIKLSQKINLIEKH